MTLQDIWAEGQGHHHEGTQAGALAMSWGIVPIQDGRFNRRPSRGSDIDDIVMIALEAFELNRCTDGRTSTYVGLTHRDRDLLINCPVEEEDPGIDRLLHRISEPPSLRIGLRFGPHPSGDGVPSIRESVVMGADEVAHRSGQE